MRIRIFEPQAPDSLDATGVVLATVDDWPQAAAAIQRPDEAVPFGETVAADRVAGALPQAHYLRFDDGAQAEDYLIEVID